MSVAFFDLDRTLISTNSATGWIKRERRLGFLSATDVLRGGWWLFKYQLGIADLDYAIREAVGRLEGDEEAEIRRRTHAYWREEVLATVRPGARRAIARHRRAGDQIVLLTSSSNFMSEVCCEDLGLDDFLSNRFEVVDGVFTGKPIEPLCFGAGKVTHAERCVQALGSTLARSTFYTDSYADLPALEAVGHPVVVHPDPRLARTAKKRGWPIVDWDIPEDNP